jgi:hypothetical protein
MRLARVGAGMIVKPQAISADVEDPFCGFRMYRLVALKRALKEVPDGGTLLRHDGWACSVELLTAVTPHLRSAAQVDISADYSRRYRGSRFRAVATLWGLLRASRDLRLRRGATEGQA